MGYAIISAIGLALCTIAWLAGRRAHPLTTLRLIVVSLVIAGTIGAIWLGYSLRELEAGNRGVADAFGRAMVVH